MFDFHPAKIGFLKGAKEVKNVNIMIRALSVVVSASIGCTSSILSNDAVDGIQWLMITIDILIFVLEKGIRAKVRVLIIWASKMIEWV